MNPYEGNERRVLFLCTAGLLRSPTAARIAAERWNWNTRAAGVDDNYALIPVNAQLCYWADHIYVMEEWHAVTLFKKFPAMHLEHKTTTLNIQDKYNRMNVVLQQAIITAIENHLSEQAANNAGRRNHNISEG